MVDFAEHRQPHRRFRVVPRIDHAAVIPGDRTIAALQIQNARARAVEEFLREPVAPGQMHHPLTPLLGEIENDALAHQRTGDLLQRPREPRTLQDVPLEKTLVEIDDLHILAFHADGAFQPPVWRMKPVREMPVEERETTALNGALELAFAEDTDMAARFVVIVVGQRPADPLRPVARYADGERAARLQDAVDFSDGLFVVRNVLQHFRADHLVETGVREGQRQRVADGQREGALGIRVHIGARTKAVACIAHVLEAEVEPDHMALRVVVHGMDMPACAATEVERALAVLKPEHVQVDCLHFLSSACRCLHIRAPRVPI